MTIKMKMKAVLFAAMFATAGLTAQTAYAGTPTGSIEADEDGFSGGFSHTFSANSVGDFTDKYYFVVEKSFNGSASVTSNFTINGPKLSDLSITGFNLVLYEGGSIINTSVGINDNAPLPPATTANDHWSIHATSLLAGDYYIEVKGTVIGTGIVTYSGEISGLNVSAVPEPETYGMMLGGLALLGVVARRKAAKKAA